MRASTSNEPFHEGEIAIQQRAGMRDMACQVGAGITPHIRPAAIPFLRQQRLLAVSTADEAGELWASVWSGEPGFIRTDDGQRVSISRALMDTPSHDPVFGGLREGRDIGMLAIDLTSRRRLRINGSIEKVSIDQIDIQVRESVGNCPKYIQRRLHNEIATTSSRREPADQGSVIDDRRRALVQRADTAFVGSIHPIRGADASHRGGEPGFIRVVDDGTLRVPDYPGNNMFMTLGNFVVDPRASLAVVDFDRARVVSFSGTARVHTGADVLEHPTGGTGRYWDLAVRAWIELELRSGGRWELVDRSPYNPQTTRW